MAVIKDNGEALVSYLRKMADDIESGAEVTSVDVDWDNEIVELQPLWDETDQKMADTGFRQVTIKATWVDRKIQERYIKTLDERVGRAFNAIRN